MKWKYSFCLITIQIFLEKTTSNKNDFTKEPIINRMDRESRFEPRGFSYLSYSMSRNYLNHNTVHDVLRANGATKYLEELVNYNIDLQQPGNFYTVFAPTNEAFDVFLRNPCCQRPNIYTGTALHRDRPYETRGILSTLQNTIILGKFTLDYLKNSNGIYLASIVGYPVVVTSNRDVVTVNGGRIIDADYYATNGVIHIVDAIHCLCPEPMVSVLEKGHQLSHKKFARLLAFVNFRQFFDQGPLITVLVPCNREMNEFYYSIGFASSLGQTLRKTRDFLRARIFHGIHFPGNLKLLPTVRGIDGSSYPVSDKFGYDIVVNGMKVYLNTFRLTKNGAIYETGDVR